MAEDNTVLPRDDERLVAKDHVMTAAGRQTTRLLLYMVSFLLDVVAIAAGFWIASMLREGRWLAPEGAHLAMIAIPVYVLFATWRDSYSVDTLRSMSEGVRRPIAALAATALILLMFTFFSQTGKDVSRVAFTSAFLSAGILIVLGRYVVNYLVWWRMGGIVTDELLIVDGVKAPSGRGVEIIDARAHNLFPDPQDPASLARLANVVQYYDRVLVACPEDRRSTWALFLKGSDVGGEIVISVENRVGAIALGEFAGEDTLVVSRGPLSLPNRVKKRLFDLALTVPALILLSPLLIVIAIMIKSSSPGPVFFKQPRVGQGNRLFNIFKFRSMRTEATDVDGNRSASRDDDRVTSIGRFIRRTSIDELPQLINVLRGEMSLVGPRPHALGSLAGDKLFWEVNERYWLRHALKPGITGLAQIRGLRGATHKQEDLEQRLQSDLEYLDGWRLWRDVTILFGTVRVLTHPNAY